MIIFLSLPKSGASWNKAVRTPAFGFMDIWRIFMGILSNHDAMAFLRLLKKPKTLRHKSTE